MSYTCDGVKLECLASNQSNFRVGGGRRAKETMFLLCRSMQDAKNENCTWLRVDSDGKGVYEDEEEKRMTGRQHRRCSVVIFIPRNLPQLSCTTFLLQAVLT